MNFGTREKENGKSAPRPLGVGATIGFCFLAGLLTFISGVAPLELTLSAFASAVYALVMLVSRQKWVCAFPVLLAFGVLFAVTQQPLLSAVYALRPILIAASLAFCISKGKKLFTCIGVCTAAVSAVILVTFSTAIYVSYGSLLTGFSTYISETKPQIVNAVLQAFEVLKQANELEFSLSEADIDSWIRQMAVILPAGLIVVAEFISATAFFASQLLLMIRSRIRCFYKGRPDYTISVPTSLFFMISGVAALLFSLSASTMFVAYAFANICIILFIPMLIQGIITLVASFKHPRSDSEKSPFSGERASGVLTLVSVLLISFFNPFFGVFFLAYYGAFSAVRRALAEYIKKKMNSDEM